jgi:hypothetical protein
MNMRLRKTGLTGTCESCMRPDVLVNLEGTADLVCRACGREFRYKMAIQFVSMVMEREPDLSRDDAVKRLRERFGMRLKPAVHIVDDWEELYGHMGWHNVRKVKYLRRFKPAPKPKTKPDSNEPGF